MRIVVTGGAGFIGSAVIRHFLRHTSATIINIDKLGYAANTDNLLEVTPSDVYRLEIVDICDEPAVVSVFERHAPDAVIHLAAETHVDRSIDGPRAFVDNNIYGTFVLLEAARRHFEHLPAERRDRFRFLHVSTDEVFGALGPQGTFSEISAYAPNSPYAASKAASDMLVGAWNTTYGVPTLISNCSNNYGPYQFPEKLIPLAILAALEGRSIPVYGQGEQVRDWLFVEDHARALALVLERGACGETFMIGGRSEARNIDIVRAICRLLDELVPGSSHRPHERLIQFVPDRPGHDARYAVDPAKIERALGWKASVGLEEGLRRTVRWYLDNRWWWEAIRARGFTGRRLGLPGASAS